MHVCFITATFLVALVYPINTVLTPPFDGTSVNAVEYIISLCEHVSSYYLPYPPLNAHAMTA